MKRLFSLTRGNPYLSWFLRIFLLLISIFFLLFSLDSFTGEHSFWHNLGEFFIHNIFVYVLLLALWIGWKREQWGGVVLIGLSVFMVFFFGGPSDIQGGTWLIVALPLVTGLLFWANHFLFRRGAKEMGGEK